LSNRLIAAGGGFEQAFGLELLNYFISLMFG